MSGFVKSRSDRRSNGISRAFPDAAFHAIRTDRFRNARPARGRPGVEMTRE
jgi:hypothetical protein